MKDHDDEMANVKPDPTFEHVGYRADRAFFPGGDLERAYSFLWIQKNQAFSILASLLSDAGEEWQPMSERDVKVAATVIQWLGTNVGFGFVLQALEECGYKIEEKERMTSLWDTIDRLHRELAEARGVKHE